MRFNNLRQREVLEKQNADAQVESARQNRVETMRSGNGSISDTQDIHNKSRTFLEHKISENSGAVLDKEGRGLVFQRPHVMQPGISANKFRKAIVWRPGMSVNEFLIPEIYVPASSVIVNSSTSGPSRTLNIPGVSLTVLNSHINSVARYAFEMGRFETKTDEAGNDVAETTFENEVIIHIEDPKPHIMDDRYFLINIFGVNATIYNNAIISPETIPRQAPSWNLNNPFSPGLHARYNNGIITPQFPTGSNALRAQIQDMIYSQKVILSHKSKWTCRSRVIKTQGDPIIGTQFFEERTTLTTTPTRTSRTIERLF